MSLQPVNYTNFSPIFTIPPGTDPFPLLPREALLNIFSNFCTYDCIPARFVCQRFRHLIPIPSTQCYDLHLATQGFLNLLKWAKSQKCPLTRAPYGAAKGGHLRILRWLDQNQTQWASLGCALHAIKNGKLKALKWLICHGSPIKHHNLAIPAAESCSKKMMKWAFKHGGTLTHEAGIGIKLAEKGRVDLLAWLVDKHKYPLSEVWMREAAMLGHLDLLKWGFSRGLKGDVHTFSNAAIQGNLEVLQCLLKHGCPWDESVCRAAANNSNWAALAWLRAHGAPEYIQHPFQIQLYIPHPINNNNGWGIHCANP